MRDSSTAEDEYTAGALTPVERGESDGEAEAPAPQQQAAVSSDALADNASGLEAPIASQEAMPVRVAGDQPTAANLWTPAPLAIPRDGESRLANEARPAGDPIAGETPTPDTAAATASLAPFGDGFRLDRGDRAALPVVFGLEVDWKGTSAESVRDGEHAQVRQPETQPRQTGEPLLVGPDAPAAALEPTFSSEAPAMGSAGIASEVVPGERNPRARSAVPSTPEQKDHAATAPEAAHVGLGTTRDGQGGTGTGPEPDSEQGSEATIAELQMNREAGVKQVQAPVSREVGGLRLRLERESGGDVAVDVRARGGQVEMRVRSADGAVTSRLEEGLPGLLGQLADSGFRARLVEPDASSTHSPDHGARDGGRSGTGQGEPGRDDGWGSNGSAGGRGQSGARRQGAVRTVGADRPQGGFEALFRAPVEQKKAG